MRRFEIYEHGSEGFVVVDNQNDDPAPVFATLEEARAYRKRQFEPMPAAPKAAG